MGGATTNSPPVYYQMDPSSQSPIQQTTTHTVRLIYAKSAFCLHMDTLHLQGYLTIVANTLEHTENQMIYLAWIPYHLIDPLDKHYFTCLDGGLASDQEFPAIHLHMGLGETTVIAINTIHSLYVHPPSPNQQGSIVITTSQGDVLRPLWYQPTNPFDAWPGYNVLDILKAFVDIEKTRDDPYLYLISMSANAQQHLAISPAPPSPSLSTMSTVPESDPLYNTLQEARWHILERFSRITRASRDAATHVLEHPVTQPLFPMLPASVQALRHNDTAQQTINDYNLANYYLTQWAADTTLEPLSDEAVDRLLKDTPEMQTPLPTHSRRAPTPAEEWVDFFNQDGVLKVPLQTIRARIFQGGLEPDIRIEAWKFLLGIYPWQSTFDDREAIRRSKAEEYYAIKAKWFNDLDTRNTPRFLEEKHRIDKDVHRTDRNLTIFAGEDHPNPDPQMAVGTNPNLEIMKDILVTYNYHNTSLGYVQGMSDLCAPMFVGMGDEAMAFWGFVSFMDRVQSNFFTDQSGMHRQLKTLQAMIQFMDMPLYKHLEQTETLNLFVCFRWLLVWFKREFDWEDVIRLWEVLWTDHLSHDFILFVALAVLHQHRQALLNLNQFDEILKYINELSGKLQLTRTLETAEILFYQFKRRVRAMETKRHQLHERLQRRSVWTNENERNDIQVALNQLQVDTLLLQLLPS
ncbi:RabGAP/TBC [Hesseltinella vesiculosa]|uniref:RabGAP/TBC n=1 Tax=Hesseltinella vesiculosa TaxID=101127 RepID=A0A1X2G776_9FUNG|nr:RabGAP/TBC [Hesseltinella vesiculosa]